MQLGGVSAAALRHRAESAGEGEGVAIAHRRTTARKWLPHDSGGEGRVGLVVHWRRKEAADGGGDGDRKKKDKKNKKKGKGGGKHGDVDPITLATLEMEIE